MVCFADELLHRLEILQPDPGSLLIVTMPEARSDWDCQGLDDIINKFGLQGVIILPPGATVEDFSPAQKSRLARKWLNEEIIPQLSREIR